MRHALMLILGLLATADDAKSGFNPAGIWEGALDVGTIKLRLNFHVAKAADGSLTATMESPDQGVKGIAVKSVSVKDGEFTLDVPSIGAKFAGAPSADGKSIPGKWTQSGSDFKLVLGRVDKITEVKRRQHPVKPYPYLEEEVTVENKSADVTLAGTFTKPKGDGPFPAVVLSTGSGPQDRDESLMGHKPFLVLADHLTRHGIAVLRCDDRGIGKSTGKHGTATSADFATDVHAAVRYLKTRNDVNPKRIGIIGHSEGGLIAPIIAADHPDDVGFIVMLAGPGLPGADILVDQQKAILVASKVPAAQIDVLQKLQKVLMAAAKEGAELKQLHDIAGKFFDGLSDDEKKIFGEGGKPKEAEFRRLTSPWMAFFLQYDPRPNLKKVRCPVLALNGELDLQVTPKLNLPIIAATIKEGGNANVTTRELAGLNHMFQHTKTGLPSEYGSIEETFAPEALDAISTWILKQK